MDLKLRASSTKSPIIAKTYQFTRGSLIRRLHHRWKNGFYYKFTNHQADDITLLGTYPKICRPKCFHPMRGNKLLSPQKGKNVLQSSVFLFICIIFPSFETRILVILYSISKSYAYVAETPTRVCLTTLSWGNLRALKGEAQPIALYWGLSSKPTLAITTLRF